MVSSALDDPHKDQRPRSHKLWSAAVFEGNTELSLYIEYFMSDLKAGGLNHSFK